MCRKDCSTTGACPFSFSEVSEKVQNYGCLPSPMEIVHMRYVHGKTWACHEDTSKPCLGALKFMKKLGMDNTVIDVKLITEEDDWGAIAGTERDNTPLSTTQEEYNKRRYL